MAIHIQSVFKITLGVFKMSVNLPGSGVDLIKRTQME